MMEDGSPQASAHDYQGQTHLCGIVPSSSTTLCHGTVRGVKLSSSAPYGLVRCPRLTPTLRPSPAATC